MKDRALGAIYGLALGDILGATLEFMSRDQIREIYPSGLREIVGGGAFDWAPGEVTDDTDMALCLMRGITKAGKAAPISKIVNAVGAEFMQWRATNPPDIGNTIRFALNLFARHGEWDLVAKVVKNEKGEYAGGNGALMRTLPISLFWPRDEERVIDVSRALTHMTHPHPEAEWCSIFYNLFICGLVRGKGKESSYQRALERAPLDDLSLQRIAQRFHGFPSALVTIDESKIRSSGYCVDTLEAALWALWTTESAEECIVRAANLGDDADTVAAVAGGMAGALYGQSDLPSRWMVKLEEEVRDEIASLGERF